MGRTFYRMGRWGTYTRAGNPVKHKERPLIYDPVDWSSKPYTERQLAILRGEINLSRVRLTEIAAIKSKADAKQDAEVYGRACELYEMWKNIDGYKPKYSVEEAKEVLQRLSNHKIDWDKY